MLTPKHKIRPPVVVDQMLTLCWVNTLFFFVFVSAHSVRQFAVHQGGSFEKVKRVCHWAFQSEMDCRRSVPMEEGRGARD